MATRGYQPLSGSRERRIGPDMLRSHLEEGWNHRHSNSWLLTTTHTGSQFQPMLVYPVMRTPCARQRVSGLASRNNTPEPFYGRPP